MANGIPSRRRQISTTAAASSAWPSRSAAQRSGRVRRTGSPPQSRFPRRRPARAPATTARRRPRVLRGWWPGLVTVAECARMASIRSAAASSTCSQLSNTNSRDPALQRGGHRLAHALARLLGDAQHRRHRVGHRRRIGDRGQFENPDTVGELVGQPRRDLQRQAGLADPAHTGQRHQPMCSQRRLLARRPPTTPATGPGSAARSATSHRAASAPALVGYTARIEAEHG